MHYSTLFLTALLTTTTLVFATDPYVQSFSSTDCTGPSAGDKTTIKGSECVRFDSVHDTVQVNYGTNSEETNSLTAYSDDDCQVPTMVVETEPVRDGSPARCISQVAFGLKWGSVRKT